MTDNEVAAKAEEHSKTPWEWGDFSAFDADGNMVLYYTIYDDGIHTNMPGDKAFIVKAVNCHEELVAALDEVMTWIRNWDSQLADDPEWFDAAAKVKAVLEKAK